MQTTSTVIPYFLYSTGILCREGLEAMLVIIALLAGTREAGQERRARDVYAGALIAIGASIALAWAVNHVIGDNTSDTLEGVFQLFAAATLFYVSSWITAKSQAQRWKNFIQSQVEAAKLSKGPSLALGLTAFLAVMREGAETIVFFQALAAGATERAERHAVMLGVVAGAIALTVTFVALRKMVSRIPIGAFFSVTSILLYAMAMIFAGQGIASFQESGVMGATFIDHLPTIQMLGFYPTVQTIAAQGILLMLAAAAAFAPVFRRSRPIAGPSIDARGSHRATPRAV
jgi:high-affinity iron transporter